MSKSQFDADQFRQFMRLLQLGDPEAVIELRALGFGGRDRNTFSGYFNNENAFAEAAKGATKNSGGVHCTINVLNPQLLCRSANRAKPFAQLTTSDADILRRRYLPIDLDAIRPAGTSSSDEQHEAAIEKSRGVFKFIRKKDWPEPIVIDSGNGAHLLMPFDEPNDQNAKTLAQNILKALAEQFNDEWIKVDESVFNPARIMRLPCTTNRKGDHLPKYPHRLCRILRVPEDLRKYADTPLAQEEAA